MQYLSVLNGTKFLAVFVNVNGTETHAILVFFCLSNIHNYGQYMRIQMHTWTHTQLHALKQIYI